MQYQMLKGSMKFRDVSRSRNMPNKYNQFSNADEG